MFRVSDRPATDAPTSAITYITSHLCGPRLLHIGHYVRCDLHRCKTGGPSETGPAGAPGAGWRGRGGPMSRTRAPVKYDACSAYFRFIGSELALGVAPVGR